LLIIKVKEVIIIINNKQNSYKNNINNYNKKQKHRFNRRNLIIMVQFFVPNKTNKRMNRKDNY
jgi:hypothetical protein